MVWNVEIEQSIENFPWPISHAHLLFYFFRVDHDRFLLF